MHENLRKAGIGDLRALTAFYEEVCAAQEHSPWSPQWHFGIYPDEEDLAAHIREGEFMLLLSGERIAAAAVLAGKDDPIYAEAAWHFSAKAEEVCVLHLFAVHPDFRRTGVSNAMLSGLIASAEAAGRRLMRLDVVCGNLPAERLYAKHGFRFAEQRRVFYEDTGEIEVRLYERLLSGEG